MKAIKHFIKSFDFFDVFFSFSYKNEKKYSTLLGGIVFILFFILSLSIGIYYFIPFVKRENFSIIYYTMILDKSETIIFPETKSTLATGLGCDVDENDGTRGEDLFELKINYVTYNNDLEGKKIKSRETIYSHPCTYEDFYNNNNETFDKLKINKYQCFDKINYEIEGIYGDDIFKYYEIFATAKEDNPEKFEKISNYLINNSCYLKLIYMDNSLDVNNYKKPINSFINDIFIELNPVLYLKMNVYFMNRYFEDDHYLFSISKEKEPIKKIIFSRTEDYFSYKGKDRGEKKPQNYQNFAKFFVRADIKKIEVKRKYQKLMEFLADSTSLSELIFNLLYIILNFTDSFYADHSLGKRLFLFKEMKNKNFDIFKKHQKIKELIEKTSSLSDKYNKKSLSIKKKNKKILLNNDSDSNLDININNKTIIHKNLNNIGSNIKIQSYLNNKILNNPYFKIFNQKNNKIVVSKFKIENTYNILEIFISSFLCCFMPKNLRIKNNINLKSNNFIYNKLDVILYIKNMIILDIMNQILLDDHCKNIIKFLCYPILTMNEEEKENQKFYKKYNEDDFNDFYEEISELNTNTEALEADKKLIIITKQKLKQLI